MPKISFQKLRAALFEADKLQLDDAMGFKLDAKQLERIQLYKLHCNGDQEISPEVTFKHIKLSESFEQEIDGIYVGSNLKYKYFSDSDKAPQVFKEFFIISSVLANIYSDFEGCTVSPEIRNIYKLMVLFEGESPEAFYNKLDKFFSRNFGSIKEFKSFEEGIKIASCKEFEVVKYDLVQARKLLISKTDATKVAKNFHLIAKFTKVPNDAATFNEVLFKFRYTEAPKDPDLAALCSSLGAENFAAILHSRELGLLPIVPKTVSTIPDIQIEFKSGLSIYHLVKLPETNPRALHLGNLVGNCMSWPSEAGGPNVNNVIHDTLHRENMGIYAIVKAGKKKPFEKEDLENLEKLGHEFVGKSPIWVGADNSINFGVLAVKSARAANFDVIEIMEAFGLRAESLGFDRIVVGGLSEIRGIRNLDKLESMHTEWNSIPREGYKYAHILHQQEAYISQRLAAARADLRAVTKFEDQSHITSVSQAEVVKVAISIIGAEIDQETYVKYSNCYVMRNWDAEGLVRLVQAFEEMKTSNPTLYEKLFDFTNSIKFTPGTCTEEYISYKYGITIEDIFNLPEAVINDLLGNKIVKKAIVRLSDMKAFSESLQSVDSELSLKRTLVKAYARDLSKEEGDLSYLDTMSENRCEKILKSSSLIAFGFTNIRELATLSDEVFDYVTIQLADIYGNAYLSGYIPKLAELGVGNLDTMKKGLLARSVAYKSTQDPKFDPFEDSFVQDLTQENLLICTGALGLRMLIESDSLSEIIQDPKEAAVNIQRRIIEIGYLNYNKSGIERSEIEFIRSLDEEACHFVFSADLEVAIRLVEPNVMKLYKEGRITLDDLQLLDNEMLNILLSNQHLVEALDRPVEFLRSCPKEKFSLFAGNFEICALHKAGKLDLVQLASYDEAKIKALNSYFITHLIKEDAADFTTLLELNIDQIEVIGSGICQAIREGKLQAENLKESSAEQLKELDLAILSDLENVLDLDHLRCQNAEMIQALSNVKYYINTLGLQMWQYELANHSVEKIDYLFSYEEGKCSVDYFCQESKVEFLDLVELPMDKLQILLRSFNNTFKMQPAGLNIEALREMEKDKLELLLSDEVDQYIQLHWPTKLADLVGMDVVAIQGMIHPEGPDLEVLGDT